MDWVDPISSETGEERDDDMSSLANGFSTTMLKRVASTQGETTPGFEVSGEKFSKWPGLDEEDLPCSSWFFFFFIFFSLLNLYSLLCYGLLE